MKKTTALIMTGILLALGTVPAAAQDVTWTRVFGTPSTDAGQAVSTDSAAAYVVGTSDSVMAVPLAQFTWATVASPTGNTLAGVDFADASTGWAVGRGGVILYTSTAGASWLVQDSGIPGDLNRVDALDASTAYAVGNLGVILSTTDGGSTWVPESSGVGEALNDVDFPSASVGYACGTNGTIIKYGGGLGWTSQSSGTTEALTRVFFFDSDNGLACGAAGTLLRTTDGGTNWNPVNSNVAGDITGIEFADANTGICVTSTGEIALSTDGGQTWAAVPSGVGPAQFFGVHMASPTQATIVGNTVLRTDDGGSTWYVQPTGTLSSLLDVAFFGPAPSAGAAVGENGTIVQAVPQGVRGGDDVFVRKYDTEGNVLWTRQIGSPAADTPYAVTTSGGAVYVGGSAQGAFPGQPYAATEDAFLCKFTPGGTLLWLVEFGFNGTERVAGLVSDGVDLYLTGIFNGNSTLLRRYTADGALVWDSPFTATGGVAFGLGICAGPGGEIYLCGSTTGAFTGFANAGGEDAWVRRIDTNGSEVWTDQVGTAGTDFATGVYADPTGVYVAANASASIGGQPYTGGWDCVVRKYDTAGNAQWTDEFGSTLNDRAEAITGDGGSITVGGSVGLTLPGMTSAGSTDAFVRRYDLAGTPQWTRQFGSNGADGARGVTTIGGNAYATGMVAGGIFGEPYTGGASDAFLVRMTDAPHVPGVVYVKSDAGGANNGSSWGDAYTDLQLALGAAESGDSIWVAGGTYRPTTGGDRTATFTLPAGVAVYGGFSGGEADLSQRDWAANVTILSGDIGAPADTSDNSYHVVVGATGSDSTSVLDGFTVTGGNGVAAADGGGLYLVNSSPVVRYCTFVGNYAYRGGAAYVFGGGPRFESCTFGGLNPGDGNAASAGGAVFNDGATSTFLACTFQSNAAPPNNGGATDNAWGAVTSYTQCVFQQNSALVGGAVNVYESETALTDCRFYENQANFGGAVMMQAAPGVAASPGADASLGARRSASLGTSGRTDAPARSTAAAAGDLTVTTCDFELNNAIGDGGGIEFIGVNLYVRNSRFYDNTSGGSLASGGANPFGGGGIAVYQGVANVDNCTLASNDAYGTDPSDGGAGIFVYGSTLNLSSSILWGNNDSGATDPLEAQIRVTAGVSNMTNSVVQGLPAVADNNNTGRDPLLGDWVEGGDLHPGLASPAINRGTNNLINFTTDLDGNPRVSAGEVDAGCYEYQVTCPPGSRLYVYGPADGGDGTSWVEAYKRLEDALAIARLCGSVSEIWVAGGTYTPSAVNDRLASFDLVDQVAVYGGFSVGDGSLGDRDPEANVTTLSGDLGVIADSIDNSYHVIAVRGGIDPGTRLDGFTVTGGNADGGGEDSNGAGMLITGGSPDIANVKFVDNHAQYIGGGVASNGEPAYDNVLFQDNSSVNDGGGVWQYNGGEVTYRNCRFVGNSGLFGGGTRTGGPCEFTNVEFYGNSAVGGGGMINFGDAVLTNVTMSGNSAGSYGGGGMSNGDSSTPTIINTIVWFNTATEGEPNLLNDPGSQPTISNSLIQGSNGSGPGWIDSYGIDGGSNIDTDPFFVSGSDLHLSLISPAANAGSNSAPNLLATDLDGNSRIVGGVVDMGPYESAYLADSDGDGIADVDDACPLENSTLFDRNNDGCIDDGAGGRHVEYWGEPDSIITYVINEDGAPGAGGATIYAVVAAFDAWQAIPGMEQQASYGGTTTQQIADGLDRINLVTAKDTDYAFGSATLAVGLTTSFVTDSLYMGRTYRAGEIVDADMLFNPAKVFTTTGGTGSDVQAVATHEAGHIFGLSHSAVLTSTMFYVLPPGTNARTLEADDIQALLKSYPDDATLANGNRISGSVFDQAGEGVAGAIVFATNAASGDTSGCEYTLPDGRYAFIGLPDGDYYISIHPMDGSSSIGYLIPERVNQLITDTALRVFQPEYYDDAESSVESDPNARTAISVSGGTQSSGVDLLLNIDAVPPAVVSVNPPDGAAGVAATSPVLIRFSEKIDSGTLVGNFSLVDSATASALGGNAAFLDDDSLISFTPTSGLAYNTTYELHLETGLQDLYGNGLASPFVSTFRTEDVPPYGLTGLVPDKGVEGSVVVVTGNDLSDDPGQLTVTFDGVAANIVDASTTELVVVVPEGAGSGDVVVNKVGAGPTNAENFTVLPPAETLSAVEVGAVALGSLPRAVDALPSGEYGYIATDLGASAVVSNPGRSDFLTATPMSIAGGLKDLAVRPDGRRAYGVSFLGGSISVIDTDADTASPTFNTVLGTVPTPAAPLGVTIAPTGGRAYVPDEDGDIEVWDVSQPSGVTQVGTITSPDPNIRGKMAIDPVRNELLVLAGTGKVLFFDLTTNAYVGEVAVGSDPRDVAIDAAAVRAYVTDNNGFVTIVTLSSRTRVTPDVTTGGSLRGVSLTPAGLYLFAANRQLNNIDVVDLDQGNSTFRTLLESLPQGVNPVDVEVSPDGQYLYSLVESTQQFVVTSINAGPAVETLSRYAGPVDSRLVIAGQSLVDSLASVTFNGVVASPLSSSDSVLSVVVPAGATSGPVRVTTVDSNGMAKQSNEIFFDVLGLTQPGGLRLAFKVATPPGAALSPAMDVSPTGNVMVFGGDNGELWVVDIDPDSPDYNQVIATASPSGGTVDDIAITPDGRRALVLDSTTPALAVVDVNPLSPGFGNTVGTVDLSAIGTASSSRMAVSPDGFHALIGDPDNALVHVIDIRPGSAQAYQIVGAFAIGGGTNGRVSEMAFHPEGRYVYMPVRDATGQWIAVGDMQTLGVTMANLPATVPAEIPMDVAFTPDGSRAFVLTSQLSGPVNRSVLTIDTADPLVPALLADQPFGGSLGPIPEHLAVSPRGDRVIFGVRGEGFFNAEVMPDSLMLLEQTGNIFFHLTRTDMGFAPDASRLYTTSSNLDSLWVYDFSTAQQIAIDSGNAQMGVIDQELPSPLRVLVTDAGSNPVSGVPVHFDVASGGGHFVGTGSSTQIAPSDINGIAEVRLVLGSGVGPATNTVTATAAGLSGSPLTFTADATDDPANLPLSITRVVPANASSGISVTTALQASFTRAVDRTSVSAATFFLRRDSDAAVIPTETGITSDGKSLSLTPNTQLDFNTSYSFVIGALQDDAGGPLTNPTTATFTTIAAPPPLALEAVDPPSATPNVTVVLSGTSFDPVPGANTVLFNSDAATPDDGGVDFLNVTVPLGATSGTVRVVAGPDTSNAIPFTVIQPQTTDIDEVIATIGTGSPTKGLTISPDGTIAYAVSPGTGTVVPIDIAGETTYPSISVGNEPIAITITPDGKKVFVANLLSGTVSVIDSDPASPTFQQVVETIVVGTAPSDLVVSPDGDRLYVANGGSDDVSVVDSDESSAAHLEVIATIGVGTGTKGLTISPDGTELYVGNDQGYTIVDPLGYSVIATIGVGTSTKGLTISPDGTLLYLLTTEGEVLIIDNESGSATEDQVIATIGTGGGTKGLTISPDGTQLYLIQDESDVIIVVDVTVANNVSIIYHEEIPGRISVAVSDTLDVGEDPTSLVFDPSGSGLALLTSPGNNTVVFLGANPPTVAADIYVEPRTLNEKSKGRFIKGTIELPEPYLPQDIVLSTVMLNDTLLADPDRWSIADADSDGIDELLVKFDRALFQMVMPQGEYVPVTITGMVDGQPFAGMDTIRTIRPTVKKPASFASLTPGQSTTIEWDSPAGVRVDYVDVYFSADDGENWTPVTAHAPDTQSIPWTAPLVYSDECRVMVTLYRDDESVGSGMNQYPFIVNTPVSVSLASVDIVMDGADAVVTWETNLEYGTQGFYLSRSTERDGEYVRVTKDMVEASGRVEGGSYQFRDPLVEGNRAYYYQLEEVTRDGEISTYGPYKVEFRIAYGLDQNVPNPFNPTTSIRFSLARRGAVRLEVYDVAGRRVRTLVDGVRPASVYTVTWDGLNDHGERVSSGVYFYRLASGSFRATKKMVLLK